MIEDVIIYSKNGVAKHESKTGYNNDGGLVKTSSIEYHGTWMGDCYVNITVHSAYPIDFQIGDYINYRGEIFTLANDPAVIKASERGTYGEGFDYKDIKFSSRGTELTDIRFFDVVLADNEIHYTSLPDFPFYAASIEDYADRLQANTNRWCTENGFILTDYWLFVTPNKVRFVQRAGCLRKDANDQWEGLTEEQATAIWVNIYGNDGSYSNVENEKKDVSVTISGENIWDSLARIKNDFGLNFFNRDRKVIIGSAGIELARLFKYGKGNGLYEMERQVDNDQQVITKLYAYGSDKNMPVRYYANVQKDYFDYVVNYKAEYHDRFGTTNYELELVVDMDMDYDDNLFTKSNDTTDWAYNGYVDEKFEVEIEVDDCTIIAYAFKKPGSDKLSLYSIAGNSQNTYHMSTKAELEAFVAAIRVSDKVFFTKHINKKNWPEEKYEYSNIYSRGYAVVSGNPYTYVKTASEVDVEVYTSTPYVKESFVFRSRTNPGSDGNPNFVCTLKIGNVKVVGRIQEDEYDNCTIRVYWTSSEHQRDYYEQNKSAAEAFYDAVASGTTIYICSGIDYKTFPTVDTDYTEPDLPNNMSVNKLMLPGFPIQSLYAWVKAQPDCTAHNDATGEATWRGHTAIFSKEKYRPFILSLNAAQLGIKEGSKNFDGSDDTDEIFPTLEDTGYDIIRHADIIGDNGVFEDGSDTPTIKLTVPNFDDDLDQLLEEGTADGGTPTINMKTGYCGGRDLKINIDSVKRDGNFWIIECDRNYDSLLERYFPYSYNVSIGEKPVANEAYQIRGSDISGYDGDKFVYTGIPLSKTYIDAASVKLLEESLVFLEKNDYTRYTYLPKIDEILMAREQEDAFAYGRTSLHDLIKEGDLLNFKDDDLQIDYSLVFIDSLTIKEDGNNGVPTYEVTLRNEKTVGTLQRIQNQVNSIASGVAAGAAGGGYSETAIRDIVNSEVESKYLKKNIEDQANALIGFAKGLWVGIKNVFGISREGDATFRDLEAKGDGTITGVLNVFKNILTNTIQSYNYSGEGMTGTGWQLTNDNGEGNSVLSVDYLNVRMRAIFNELEVRKMIHTAGNYIFSPAGSIIERVDYYGFGDTLLGYEYIKSPWLSRAIPFLTLGKFYAKPKVVRVGITDSQMGQVLKFRCYLKSDDGTTQTTNTWQVGMLARCESFDINQTKREGDGTTGNVFYWRKVIEVSSTAVHYPTLDDGLLHHYVDLTNQVGKYASGSMVPNAGDSIVCFGADPSVTGSEAYSHAVVIETVGPDAPALKEYMRIGFYDDGTSGINWSLTDKMRTKISPKTGNRFIAPEFIIETSDGDELLYRQKSKGSAKAKVNAGEVVLTGSVGDILLVNYSTYSPTGTHIRVCTSDNPVTYQNRSVNLGDSYILDSSASTLPTGNGHLFEATETGWEDKGLISESKSQLKVTVDGISAEVSRKANVNLLPLLMWTDGTNVLTADVKLGKVGQANSLYSPQIFLEEGTYVFSGYFGTSALARIETRISESGNITWIPAESASPNYITPTVISGDSYQGADRYYFLVEIPTGGRYVRINIYIPNPTGDAIIYRPQLEKGTTATTYTPDGDAVGSTGYANITAEVVRVGITNDLGDTGIDIEHETIELRANKVTFSNSAGTVSGKISIDPTTGALKAVDGDFEGTVRAKNVFESIALTSGTNNKIMNTVFLNGSEANLQPWEEDSSDAWVFFYNTVTIDGVTFNSGTYYLGSEINALVDSSYQNFWVQEEYYDLSGWRVCTGPASLILAIPNGSYYPYGKFYIPRASDYQGKLITIKNPYLGTHNTMQCYQVDNPFHNNVQRNDFVTAVSLNNGHVTHTTTSDAIYLTIDDGKEVVIYSTGARWLKISEQNLGQ